MIYSALRFVPFPSLVKWKEMECLEASHHPSFKMAHFQAQMERYAIVSYINFFIILGR